MKVRTRLSYRLEDKETAGGKENGVAGQSSRPSGVATSCKRQPDWLPDTDSHTGEIRSVAFYREEYNLTKRLRYAAN